VEVEMELKSLLCNETNLNSNLKTQTIGDEAEMAEKKILIKSKNICS